VPPLRIAITLPGEASLGTFEAGAMAALCVGLQAIDEPGRPVIDVLTGASSGALTAVLAARVLLAGEDPVRTLRRAWVSEPTLDALTSHDTRAPLTLDRARDVAGELLSQPFPDDDVARQKAQSVPVTLDFALACLRGWTYQIPPPAPEDLTATSYVDWSRTSVGTEDADRGGFTPKWQYAVESAIASASHPLAFPPTSLDRSSQAIRDEYDRNRVLNFPDDTGPGSRELWYSDGGLVDRQPLGRCIASVQEIEEPGHRLFLVLRPEAERAPPREDPAWTEAGAPPTWRETLSRALRIVAGHSLQEDLRAVEKINQRIRAQKTLETALIELLRSHHDREEVLARLTTVAGEVEELRSPWRHHPEPHEMAAARAPRTGAGQHDERVKRLVRQVLETTTGLSNKIPVQVELISGDPAYLTGGGHHQFGGFLAESLRANDFLVGYEAMLAWMDRGLHRHGVSGRDQKVACDAARDRAATIPGWLGGVTNRRRASLRTQQEVARVGLKAAWIALKGRRARSGA
jgi:predicted acylesterase/phospholipase RssA